MNAGNSLTDKRISDSFVLVNASYSLKHLINDIVSKKDHSLMVCIIIWYALLYNVENMVVWDAQKAWM